MEPRKGEMTPRERVLATAKGLPVDRIPVMYWINPHTTCKMMARFQPARNRFYNLLGRRAWKRFSTGGMQDAREIWRAYPLLLHLYSVSEYALELGADLANLPFGTSRFWGKIYLEKGHIRVKSVFGSIHGIGGIYLEVFQPAIKNINDLRNFKFRNATDDKHYARIRRFRKAHPKACIFVDNLGVQDAFASQIWEMSRFMMALYDYPDEIKDFQRRFADWQIDIARRSVKAGADLVFIYDDYGHTTNTLISVDMWKEFTYPHLKRQIEAVHDAGALVMLHSCGHQMPLLKYYVDAELDILQPFQPMANNDFKQAYKQYGDKLCFATGIEAQQGESMTPDELREDILRYYRIGGRNGRHILSTTHMIQYTMPDENIRTILNTVREIQTGIHDN